MRAIALREAFQGKHKIYPMVISVAYKVWRRSGAADDYYDDVLGEALLGLMKASKKFHARNKSNAKFSTYAHFKITGAAKDTVRKEMKHARRFIVTDPFSMEYASDGDGVHEKIAQRQLITQLYQILQRELPQFDSQLLILFYLKERPEEEIADTLRCTRELVRHRRKEALRQAKEALRRRGFQHVTI